MRERVERTALAVGLEGETRPYHPHLTLARWERGGCGGPRKQDVSRLPGGQAVGTFHVSSICLFESLLGPGGARYRKVMEFSL
ncbi:MAG: 2'-5' RNA ligase family protein [Acidobacteriota bacterium]